MHQQQHQHQQRGLSSSARNVNNPARGNAPYNSPVSERDGGQVGVGSRAGGAAAVGYRGQTARDQRPGPQIPPTSTCDASDNEFPFPDAQDQEHNGGGRRGQTKIEAEKHSRSAPSGAGEESIHEKDGVTLRPAAATVTRRSSRSAEKGTRRLSRSGSGSRSGSHERLHMHTFSSRRRSSSSFGSPDRGSSSPGWSSYARRLSGADVAEGGGTERDRNGVDHNYHPASGSVSTAGRSLAQNKDNNFDGAPLREAWAQEGAGGEPQGNYGAPVTQAKDARAAAAQRQEAELDAVGRKDWAESGGAWADEGARRGPAGRQRRGEWNGNGGSGSGGREQQQAGEKMVDEDAYRFRSFSEEV